MPDSGADRLLEHAEYRSAEWRSDREPGIGNCRRNHLLHRRRQHADTIFSAVPGAISGGFESDGQSDCHRLRGSPSTVSAPELHSNIPSGTLVWSDEFTSSSGTPAQPNPASLDLRHGHGRLRQQRTGRLLRMGFEHVAKCSTTNPSEYVAAYPGTDGVLYIVAQSPSTSVYTSARLKTQGLFSFQYGRIEFRAQVPEAQGFWPADWLLGNNIATVNWPACGEQDVLERESNAAGQAGLE